MKLSTRLPADDATNNGCRDVLRVRFDLWRRIFAPVRALLRKSGDYHCALRFCVGAALLGLLTGGAHAQGWGEQRPLQFAIVGPGGNLASTEIVRRQLQFTEAQTAVLLWNAAEAAAANAAAAASGGGGGGAVEGVNGSSQGSEQLNNAVKTSPVLNVTVSGAGNSVTVSPNAQAVTVGQTTQNSTGTNQGSSNSQATAPTFLNVPGE